MGSKAPQPPPSQPEKYGTRGESFKPTGVTKPTPSPPPPPPPKKPSWYRSSKSNADQQAENERLKDLLREAVECMDDTPDGWAEDWVKRAAQAAGGNDGP